MNRLLPLLFALSLFAGHASGQTADTPIDSAPAEYMFRFVADDDMFYIPWNGNGEELDRLLACIAENHAAITDGTVPVLVDGYCTSQSTVAENFAMAMIRSNRVKTEMILRGGLTETCFTTKNHAAKGNFVTVRIIIPAGLSEAEAEQTEQEQPTEEQCKTEEVCLAVEQPEAEQPETEQCKAEEVCLTAEQPETEQPETEQCKAEEACLAAEQHEAEGTADRQNTVIDDTAMETEPQSNYHLSLRANLLRWATLTPDLGLEWRIRPSWGIAVNGSWTSWTMCNNAFRYALWEVMPEVRWYVGEKRAWYVGAMFKTGQFDYKVTETGRQGDLMGGGITGGYQLRLNKTLNIDFSLGLGYLNADYEKYEVIDGVRVSQGTKTEGWWGPINVGVSLVWKLF